MKKILFIFLSALLLNACSEHQQFEETVLSQMKSDKDIADYNIDPEDITDCVVDTSTKEMPGIFPADPRRKPYLIGYSKMLGLKTSEKPQELLKELTEIFGSSKGIADAHKNYSTSVMMCVQAMVGESME